MLGVFAEFERVTIVERVIAGMERKAATGAWPGGYRPFGYEPDPETGFLTVKEDEARWCPSSSTCTPTSGLGPVRSPAGSIEEGTGPRPGSHGATPPC